MSDGPDHEGKKGSPPYAYDARYDLRLQAIEREQQEDRRRQHEHNDKQIFINKWLAALTFALVIATVASDCLIFWYVQVTRKAADAAASSAQAANDAVQESKRQFDILQKNYAADAVESKRRFDTSADRGEKQSAASLSLAQKSLIASERPWLSVWSVSDPGDLVPNTPAVFELTVHNSGRTAALNSTHRVLTGVSPVAVVKRPDLSSVSGVPSEAMIAGDGNLSMPAHLAEYPAEVIEKAKKGELTIFLGGRVDYCDAFGNGYWLDFCYTYSFTDKVHWVLCTAGSRTGEAGACRHPAMSEAR